MDAAHAPSPRSGHSFTCVGERFFIFGGCGKASGKAQAFNDLKELDTQVPSHRCDRVMIAKMTLSRRVISSLSQDADEYKWKEMQIPNPPPPRARHCALAVRAMLCSDGVGHA